VAGRRGVKRSRVTFKTKQHLSGKRKGLKGNDKAGHNGSSTSRNTSWENFRSTQLNDIQLQNARLAKELNAFKVAKATLTDRIHTLNSEILELKVQNATQRDEMKRQQESSFDASLAHRQIEQDVQKNLQTVLDPLMKAIHGALDHTVGLSNNLTTSMQLATALDRKSKTILNSPALPPRHHGALSPNRHLSNSVSKPPTETEAAAHKKPTSSVAQILPMVKGHHISQPKIKMSRVLMSAEEMANLQRQHQSRSSNAEGAVPATVVSSSTEEEEEHSNTSENDDDDEERQNQREYQQEMRRINIENRPDPEMSAVVEEDETEEEEEEDEDEEEVGSETVVLIPRLVLDRVAIPESALLGASPSKRRRKSSPVTLRVARTPPKRESPSKRARPTHPRRRSLIRDNLDYQSSRRRLLGTSDEDPPALERTDQMSPRVIIRNDAHELMSKFNKNSQAETECDTTLSGDVETVDEGAVNLTNPYGGWSMQDESPDESGVDVNEGETSSISSSNGKDVIEKNVQSAEGYPHKDSRVDEDAEGTPTNNRVSLEPPPSRPDTPRQTPGGTQESRDEFLERVMSLDPMEGPSWLYDDNDKKRRGKPKAPKSVPATSKKTNGSSDDSGDGTSTRVTRRSGGGSGVVQVDQPIQNCDDQTQNDQSSNSGVAPDSQASSSTATVAEAAEASSSRPSDENAGRSRRRAAAAVGSLKEASANKKLRQGDPTSSSIYSDFVPGTKSHSGTNKRASVPASLQHASSGNSLMANKGRGLNKKRSK